LIVGQIGGDWNDDFLHFHFAEAAHGFDPNLLEIVRQHVGE